MSYVRRGRGFLSICNFCNAVQWLGMGLVAFLFCAPLFSQTSQGTIQGAVLDQTGGTVAGATVTVTDVARGVARTLTTDSAGQYAASALNPGTYTVRAEATGFQTLERTGVLIEVGQYIRLDLVVRPGQQTQTVTVTEEIPTINTTDATLGGTVSNEAINDLPLNGRNFAELLALRPGTVTIIGGGTGAGNQTNGRRTNSDQMRLEGIAGMTQTQGSSIINSIYRSGDTSSLIPIDAIQEFNTQQNPKAEYGFKDGGVTTVGLKSGTNSLHGTAYAFGRHASATDAANYFTKKVTPAEVQQFGATAGGPIIKDRLFWFVGAELQRVYTSDLTNNTVPASVSMATPGNPAGNINFSMVDACKNLNPLGLPLGNPGNGVNALSARISGLNAQTCVVSPATDTFENMWPYVTDTTTTGNYVSPITITAPNNNGVAKGNFVLSQEHHFSGMYFVSKAYQLGKQFPGALFPRWQTPAENNVQQTSGSWTWTPNSTWVTDLRVGYVFLANRSPAGDEGVLASDPWPKGYNMPTGVTYPLYTGSPQVQISSFTGYLGTGNQTTTRGPEGGIDIVGNVSYLRGNHSFKFGYEHVRAFMDGIKYRSAQGQVTFSNLVNYLRGSANTATILVGDVEQQIVAHWQGFFFQDDWRVTSRVTLNWGLRYEYIGSPFERHNYTGVFTPDVDPATTPAIQRAGPGLPIEKLYEPQRTDFAPRLGVAWDVRGDGRTSVRASLGVYRAPQSMKSFIDTVQFGSSFPDIGVNNSGTDANFHTPNTISARCTTPGQCNGTAAYIPSAILNWNTTGPIWPTNSTRTINGQTYTGPVCSSIASSLNCAVPGVDPHFRDPYSVQWNLSVQRSLTNNVSLEVSYVGNHGVNEQTSLDINKPPRGAGWAGAPIATCLASRPLYNTCTPSTAQINAGMPYKTKFPYLSQIGYITNGAFSNYNGLHVTLQARRYHGLSALTGYTYAHALSIGDSATVSGVGTTDPRLIREGYGNSAGDLRHRFTFSPTYDLPGMKSFGQLLEGWSMSGVVVMQQGKPWGASGGAWDGQGNGVSSAGSWNFTGPTSAFTVTSDPIPCFGIYSGCTPYPVVGGVPQLPEQCVTAAQLPYVGNAQLQELALATLTISGCYVRGGGILTPPAYGTNGNAKNIFRGQPYYNVDFSVAKDFKVMERYSAEFRVQFFNFFNTPHFAGSGGGGTTVVNGGVTQGVGGGFGYGTTTPDGGNPVLGSGGPRHLQFGLKLTF